MKTGINNIFTVFILLIMVFSGVVLPIYALIYWNIFADFNPIYIFFAITFVLGVAVSVSILYNFRLLKISNDGISCFYPFLLKKREISWSNLVKANWKIYDVWKTEIRYVLLSSDKVSIKFSDLEFENFEMLTKQVPKGDKLLKQMNKAYYTPKKVKYSMIEMMFYSALLLVALYFVCKMQQVWLFFMLISINMLLLYASLIRVIRYAKIL